MIVACSVLVLLPGLVLGPYQDASIFAAIGDQLARLHLPYRDAWDHKPPGTYLLAAISSLVPGPTWPAFWTIAVAWLAATGWVLRVAIGLPLAAIGVLSMGLYPAAVGGGETEAFAALPAAVAFAAASRSHWLAAGIGAGLALVFSVQLAPLLVALLVFAGLQPRALGRGLLGVGVVMGVVIGTLALLGILPAAYDAVVVYNGLYLGSDRAGDLPTAFYLFAVLLPMGVGLPFLSSRRLDRSDAAAAGWLVAAAVFLGMQGRLIPHYVIPLVIPLAVLARGALAKRAAVLAVSLATLVMVITSFAVAAAEAPSHRGRISAEVGEWVHGHTTSNDRILVWGLDAGIYVAAERAPAGRYPYYLPLVTHGYATRALVEAWVAQLAAAPPRLIVDAEAANGYWPENADFLRPPPPGAAGGRDLDLLEPLRDFVRKSYVFVIEIDGRKVYERLNR